MILDFLNNNKVGNYLFLSLFDFDFIDYDEGYYCVIVVLIISI